MRLLLDTHSFLWFIGGDKRISAKKYIDLPLHHRDPFDRLIVAQAQVEEMTVISKDVTFESYDVYLLW